VFRDMPDLAVCSCPCRGSYRKRPPSPQEMVRQTRADPRIIDQYEVSDAGTSRNVGVI
jgi:hypothetical protein